jgi:hypothetical protein
MRLRGVIKGDPIPNARAVNDVTLEEAYLAFMVDRGRNVEDLDMSDSTEEGDSHS